MSVHLTALRALEDLSLGGNPLGEAGAAGAAAAVVVPGGQAAAAAAGPDAAAAAPNSSNSSDAEGVTLAAACAPLQQLTGLTRLSLRGCKLAALPPQLSALSSGLLELELHLNPALKRGGDAAWQPLESLSGLTHLLLSGCDLERVPSAVSALRALARLDLRRNEGLRGRGVTLDVFAPLEGLRCLVGVDVRECRLERAPASLAALAERGVSVEM